MRTLELLSLRRQDILGIASKFGARNIRVFGSVARGDARDDSDIDLLVDFEPNRSLSDMGGLMVELRDLLGRNVDIVTEDSLYWLLRRRILKEAVPL